MLMEERLAEVNAISNDSQHRLGETSEVLKGLEDKLIASEVSFGYSEGLTGSWTYRHTISANIEAESIL